MTAFPRIVWPGLLALIAGCSSPTSPPPVPAPAPRPTLRTLHVVDGITGAEVAPALRALPGAPVDVSVPGYLPRSTSASRETVALWPITRDEAYIRRIVYETWSYAGTSRLFRWSVPSVTVSRDVGGYPLSVVASTGVVDLQPSEDPMIRVSVSPSDPDLAGYRGYTRCHTRGYAITDCRIVVRDQRALDDPLMAHELGHALGLGHSDVRADLMHPAADRPTFTADERSLLTMMYAWRPPGNAPPDDDRHLIAAAARHVLEVWD